MSPHHNHNEGEAGEGRERVPEGHLALAEIHADFARREARLARAAAAAGLTRREFLAAMAAGAAGAGMAAEALAGSSPPREQGADAGRKPSDAPPPAPAPDAPKPPARSRVIVVTHPEVTLKEYRVNPPVIRQMLDRAVTELTGAASAADAWKSLIKADDFVALKHNSIGSPTLHSHTEINEVVQAQLTGIVKINPEKFLAVDRDVPAPYNELSAPFTLPTRRLETRLRRLYTDFATAIINVAILKAHWSTGLSEAMKNHLGSINNPALYHGWEPDRLPMSVPELNALPPLRTKTRLVIIDAIQPLFAGGPNDNPDYRWDYRGLIVATDPVAASAVGLRILEAKRAEFQKKEWPMTAARLMMAHAQEIGLGNADPARIDLVEAKMG